MSAPPLAHDPALIAEIAARFDLREPNANALEAVVGRLVEAGGEFCELVADLATGVGKTFLMSALVDYVAAQGVRHVLVVTPNKTVHEKTLANFDEASAKYVPGAETTPLVVTPENFRSSAVAAALADSTQLKVFVFNVQQLIRPSEKASRKVREEDETLGEALYTALQNAGDLLVIADEHHVYHEKAKAFSAAIRDLHPLALVGLTATPDPADREKIVFQYTLGEAIADRHVKVPVIVYRKDGRKDDRTQLADACHLLKGKEAAYAEFATTGGAPPVRPVLFVVCQTIEHANETAQTLAGADMLGTPERVLEITSQSSDEALAALESVERPESPVRAIVSVNKLREGWDVKNIAVIVALRKLASQTLTEQILGRGLRLPFGERTGVAAVDQVDLVAHDSYQQLLAQKDVLIERLQTPADQVPVDEQGGAAAPALGAGGAAPGIAAVAPGQEALFEIGGGAEALNAAGMAGAPTLGLAEQDDRTAVPAPKVEGRVSGAPKILFPRLESKLVTAPFLLEQIPEADARAAGAKFILEVPTLIFRTAIEAARGDEGLTVSAVQQPAAKAQQSWITIGDVSSQLEHAIRQQPEVSAEKAQVTGARNLVKAFLAGAGVEAGEAGVVSGWSEERLSLAVEGMRDLIRRRIAQRKLVQEQYIVEVSLPLEPVIVDPSLPKAHGAAYVKNQAYTGWQRHMMPATAGFDAKSTEWELAHLLDGDAEAIAWWLRLSTQDPAYVPWDGGAYYPDFVAMDTAGVYWLIEGKSDKEASDPKVVTKREAAEAWARRIRNEESYGEWRYLFATESAIKQAAGSWLALLTAAGPE